MRIGIDARYMTGEYSGIAKYSENLLRSLSELDQTNEYEVYVHTNYRMPLQLGDNFRVWHYSSRAVSLDTLWGFGKFISGHNLDLLHSHFPIAPMTFDGRLLVTVHDLQALMVPEFTARRNFLVRRAYDLFYRWVYPNTIKRAEYLLSVSRATRDDIVHCFPMKAEEVIVVPSGLEDFYRQPLDPAAEAETAARHALPEKYLLYIGSTRPNKNLPNMIRAFAEAVRQAGELDNLSLSDMHLVLVVTPDRFFSECRHLIRHLGIQHQTKIYHNISEAEKKAFYKRAQALYFVTKNEGFGFPLLEAQACGTPVLAAQHASLPEIAQDTAHLVDPDSVEEIVRGIFKIVFDDSLRQQLIESGQQNAARYRWSYTGRRVLEIYNNLFQ